MSESIKGTANIVKTGRSETQNSNNVCFETIYPI